MPKPVQRLSKQQAGRPPWPTPIRWLPDDKLNALVGWLKGWGLDAIECFYAKYTPEQQSFYLRLAKKYRRHRTSGSDFHGERVKLDVELAALELELDWLLS